MRKFLNIITLSTVVLMASCDMNKVPEGMLDPSEGYTDISMIETMERGAYARLRDNYAIESVIGPDLQSDYVNALMGNTNIYNDLYSWKFRQDLADVQKTWDMCYQTIGQCNDILDHTADNSRFTKAEKVRLALVRGHVYLMRAMSYSMLIDHYCGAYDAATAKTAWGLPLITSFQPDVKPSRSNLVDTYDLILKDLVEAETLLAKNGDVGSPNSVYLNVDCVYALRARIYLQMKYYSEAITEAQKLISSSTYSLANSLIEFDNMWVYDKGSEFIFNLAASKTEQPASYGTPFFVDMYSGMGISEGFLYWKVDYIPTQECIDKFKAEPDDYRYQSWIYTKQLFVPGGEVTMTGDGKVIQENYIMISKFPGNPDLRTNAAWNNLNTWKVFRLAEMYLIAAEAALSVPGADAATPLNTLRAHRGLAALPVVTLADVKNERYKELLLEGFRISDLRRWGEEMKRGASQERDVYRIFENELELLDSKVAIAAPLGRNPEAPLGNFRYIWPIPFSEMYANQNLSGQQNEGWGK